jgi:pimeloyl-ACP methyl ester carboxylesterase
MTLKHGTPERFEVAFPEDELQDMVRRLRDARWADDVGNEDWAYGVEKGWLQDLVRYWTDEFDWRAQEASINELPMFRVDIEGTPIHYVHVEGKGPNPTPLILSHGWPWTFLDWRPVIGPLTDPAAHGGDPEDAFTVVIPSTPGFGFSTPLATTGFGARKIADYWAVLMRDVLGYERFAAGGGDWGSTITGELGHGYPEHVIGVWLTLPNIPGVKLWDITETDFDEDERWMWERCLEARPTITSHSTVHRIEPQTLAYGLVDSPLGTAAWLWGRRKDWSDHDGDVFEVFDRDFLCTKATIYWMTKTIGTAFRIYNEHYRGGGPPAPRTDAVPTITVPTGFGIFPHELLLIPRKVAAKYTNLQRWEVLEKGGHYPPSEQPEITTRELRAFFRPLRG